MEQSDFPAVMNQAILKVKSPLIHNSFNFYYSFLSSPALCTSTRNAKTHRKKVTVNESLGAV